MSLPLKRLHHIALICSDYERSKKFYTEVLGFRIVREIYRSERRSYKLDLALRDEYLLELFSFPNPPARLSEPEGTGLRHLAFEVEDLAQCYSFLQQKNIDAEPIRTDPYTNKKFFFFFDPDRLPIELYEKE